MLKIRRGQKVRIASTNQIATIEEIELIRSKGAVHKYCHLTTNGKPDMWMDASELLDVKEHCVALINNKTNGQSLTIDVILNHQTETAEVKITGQNPESINTHAGLHVALAMNFIKTIS